MSRRKDGRPRTLSELTDEAPVDRRSRTVDADPPSADAPMAPADSEQ